MAWPARAKAMEVMARPGLRSPRRYTASFRTFHSSRLLSDGIRRKSSCSSSCASASAFAIRYASGLDFILSYAVFTIVNDASRKS